MFIPLGTNRGARKRPVVTESLIIVNFLVFIACLAGPLVGLFEIRGFIETLWFDPRAIRPWQMITSLFVHDPGSILHVAFNMLFLWVFGAAVEDRLGRWWFLGFYLVGGCVATLGHMLVSSAPVIGASGAVAGCSGAFLALFPRARIRVLMIFFLIGVYQIPALWFIGLYFAIDLLSQTSELLGGSAGDVAYAAHLAGYVYGFFVAFALLATRLLAREEFDVFYLLQQRQRRAAFRAVNRDSATGSWASAAADTGDRLAKRAKSPVSAEQNVRDRRAEIHHLMASGDMAKAASRYLSLLRDEPDAVFNEDHQLDLANALYRLSDFPHAAAAYELFIDRYSSGGRADEVRLMLAVLYARRLNRADRARELVEACRARLRDPAHVSLATDLLAETQPR